MSAARKAPYSGEQKGAYRPKEFEIRYGVGHTKLYELLKSRQLVARKLDGATLILHDDAEAWARSLPLAEVRANKKTPAGVVPTGA